MTQFAVVAAPDDALCIHCGYALRGLTNHRCPECGRDFDPTDRWTMNVGRPHGRVVAALLSPIGRPTCAAAYAATAAVFWWTAALPGAAVAMRAGLLAWAIIYVYRVARYLGRLVASVKYVQPFRRKRRFVFLILIMLSGLMIWTRFPLYILFAMHRPAFDRLAKRYYEEVPMLAPPPPPTRIGLYSIGSISVTPSGVGISVDDGVHMFYSPQGADPPDTALLGQWQVVTVFEADVLAPRLWPVVRVLYRVRELFD